LAAGVACITARPERCAQRGVTAETLSYAIRYFSWWIAYGEVEACETTRPKAGVEEGDR
jgi:hypothetical protein